ncbi:MAG: 16S rRNA (adenine(1518)-N(6)/adenine(1519)-N(6))-dimethyltransferase RsmA [Planctomycetota bacterium]
MTVPRTKTAVRALLAAHGLGPARMRGQHFLVDPNLVDAIVRSAEVDAGDCLLEVGTGTGILTDGLANRAGRVVTCDIDARLQEITRALRPWPPSVVFLHADILRGKHALNPDVIGRWQAEAGGHLRCRVVANLPYAVATPLLANLLWQGIEMHDAVVLAQKEVAERFVATPGTAAYGPVSIAVRLLASATVLRHVGPQVFWPAPKVSSVLLRLAPRAPARARELSAAGLPELLQEGFRWRRKTLRKAFPSARLEAAGIDPGARPQEVEPALWERLLRETS